MSQRRTHRNNANLEQKEQVFPPKAVGSKSSFSPRLVQLDESRAIHLERTSPRVRVATGLKTIGDQKSHPATTRHNANTDVGISTPD